MILNRWGNIEFHFKFVNCVFFFRSARPSAAAFSRGKCARKNLVGRNDRQALVKSKNFSVVVLGGRTLVTALSWVPRDPKDARS